MTIVGLLSIGGVAHAAFTAETCFALKSRAQGSLQKCRADQHAKAVQGKRADPEGCAIKFQRTLATVDALASKAAIACRYRDNGDGTVSDYNTGLQWEKKDGDDGVANFADRHDVDNIYSWSNAYGVTTRSGTAFTDFLDDLNRCTSRNWTFTSGGFAGHCDWRLPTSTELLTITTESYPCGVNPPAPCIEPIFLPTRTYYWSDTTWATHPTVALMLNFFGIPEGMNKEQSTYVRAVRGGL